MRNQYPSAHLAEPKKFRGNFHDDDAANDVMTPEQARELKALAIEAYEPEAFHDKLDSAEAARRIAALRAKLRLLDGPPHTL